MKIKNLMVGAALSAALMFCLPLSAAQPPSEVVNHKTLPAAVQKTIKEHAAGGEIVKVLREDDKDGRWNYEVMVRTNGKEWGFEVNNEGKFVRKHDDHTKRG